MLQLKGSALDQLKGSLANKQDEHLVELKLEPYYAIKEALG